MITTNTGAKKIEGTDNWRQIFDAHNDSVDAHDKISDAMTYVVNGNKSIESVSIPVGHYFRLANSSIAGRSDGLYTAKIAIPVDTVIDATYFNEAAPITGGIAEALNSNISHLDNITVPEARTDIKSQVDNTWYTFPSSGYFLVVSKSTGNVNIQLNNTYLGGTAPANGYFCLFVFKGMNARIINMTNVDSVYFTAI